MNKGESFRQKIKYLTNGEVYYSPHVKRDWPKIWSKGKVINEKTNYDIRKFFDYKDQYFSMICGAYISSFLFGISLRNLQNNDQTSNIITTIARYQGD